jgi:DNA polymerase-3 subunit delta
VGNSGEALNALGKLREALQTLPFFGGAKVVWLKDCNFLGDERTAQSAAVTESLGNLAQELKSFKWDGVRLLLSAGKVDKRKVFYKTLDKIGSVEVLDGWSASDKDWANQAEVAARKAFRERAKNVAEDALGELIQRVGPNARQLEGEIEKLSLYVGARPDITRSDVEAVCLRNKTAVAFALADALGDRDLPNLLRRLDAELWEIRMKIDKDKSVIGLLYGLISKVRAMLLLKEMMAEGWIKPDADYYKFKSQLERVPADQFPSDKKYNPLAMHPYMLHRALAQARNYSSDELVRAMELLLRCNQRLVSSSLDDTIVLQQTLVQIVSQNSTAPRAGARPLSLAAA